MSSTMKDLGIDKLSRTDRLALVHEIWSSIVADGQPIPVSDELRAELARRAAEADADPEGDVPWEEVREHLRTRRKQ